MCQWTPEQFARHMAQSCDPVYGVIPEDEWQFVEGSYRMLILAGTMPAGNA